jgi:RNA polymerase sigma-70 factor (ECF subfamily)
VLRAQCGDREALECLLRSIRPPLDRFLRRVVKTSHAEDVLQDALVVVSCKLASLHTPELFRPWCFRIASRCAFRHLKKEKRWPQQPADESVFADLAAPKVPSSIETLDELLSLDTLSPASRAVLMLHFQEELPLSEVAAILGLPLGTVKSRLAYGLTTIRKHVNKKRSSP